MIFNWAVVQIAWKAGQKKSDLYHGFSIFTLFFLFVFFRSKLQESEKKNLELLTDIERLKKETEELRSEKGMANDIQINKNIFHIGGYQLSVILQIKYDTKGFWYIICEHTYCMMRCIHSSLPFTLLICIHFVDILEKVRYYLGCNCIIFILHVHGNSTARKLLEVWIYFLFFFFSFIYGWRYLNFSVVFFSVLHLWVFWTHKREYNCRVTLQFIHWFLEWGHWLAF